MKSETKFFERKGGEPAQAPFFWARYMYMYIARCVVVSTLALRPAAAASALARFSLWVSFLADNCASRQSAGYSRLCMRMRSLSGAAITREAGYSCVESVEGLAMPRPPSLTGSEKSARSVSLGGALPVRAGMSRVLTHSSRG